jgi:hypothetical protein
MNDTYMGGTKTGFDWAAFNWWGLFLLMLGVAWLGDTMHWWTFNWTMVGPLALIFAGFMVLVGRSKK